MRRAVTWIAAIVLVMAAAVAALEWRASTQADAFCRRFTLGDDIAAVQAAAATAGDRFHRRISADRVMVAFVGTPPFSRHLCVIEGRGGKVATVRRTHLD